MTETSRDVIDNVRVVARQKARMVTPGSKGIPVEHRDIDEVLLEDERTVFQCAHRNGQCDKYWDKPESVRAHVKTHADRMTAKRALAEAEQAQARAVQAEAELAARVARKSEGSKRGAETLKAKRAAAAAAAAEANGHAPVETLALPSNAQVQAIGVAIEGAIDQLGEMAHQFDQVRRSLQTTLHQLSTLEPIAPVDPEVLDKAAAFDAMQKLLNR
jgi:hypothetical protein